MLSVVTGKCLVLTYSQYFNQDLDALAALHNVPCRNIYFSEFKYDDQTNEYKVCVIVLV